MKICIKKKQKALTSLIIDFLMIMMFVSAITNILFWQTNKTVLWYNIYNYTLYTMLFLEVIIIVLAGTKNMNKISLCIFLICLFEIMSLLFLRNTGLGNLLKNGLTWPLLFLSVYLYVRKHHINKSWKYIALICTIICMILTLKNIHIHLTGNRLYGGVIGPIYYLISFLSLILLLQEKKTKIVLSIISVLMLIASTKRSGTIAIVLGLMLYYLSAAKVQDKLSQRITKYITFIIFGIISIFFGRWYIENYDLRIIDRFLNIFEDQGSGRTLIWNSIIHSFNDSSFLKKVFGHGFYTVALDVTTIYVNSGILAHNSYLEALYDFGYVGLFVLFVIIVFLITFMFNSLKEKKWYASNMVYIVIVTIMMSMFGYYFEESRVILPIAFTFGIIYGSKDMNSRDLSSIQ